MENSDLWSVYLRFLGSGREEKPGFLDIQKTRKRPTRCSLRLLFQLSLLAVFGLILAMDVLDLFTTGPSQQPFYGKVRKLLSTISYCSTQISLVRTCVALGFVILKGSTLYSYVQKPRDSEAKKAPVVTLKAFILKRKDYAIFVGGFLLYTARSLCILCDPAILNRMWANVSYGFVSLPLVYSTGVIFSAVAVSVLFEFPLLLIFIELCSKLKRRVFRQRKLLKEVFQEATGPSLVDGIEQVRKLYEILLDDLTELQDIFGLKLVCDLGAGYADLLMVITWTCIWLAISDTGSTFFAVALLLTGAGGVLRLVLITKNLLDLSRMGTDLAILIEDLLCDRFLKLSDSTIMEKSGTDGAYLFLERVKSTGLTFDAAGFVRIEPGIVVTGFVLMFGYFCFVVDQLET